MCRFGCCSPFLSLLQIYATYFGLIKHHKMYMLVCKAITALDWYYAAGMHSFSFTFVLVQCFSSSCVCGSIIQVRLLYQMHPAWWPVTIYATCRPKIIRKSGITDFHFPVTGLKCHVILLLCLRHLLNMYVKINKYVFSKFVI
jgi:hypothetical protein